MTNTQRRRIFKDLKVTTVRIDRWTQHALKKLRLKTSNEHGYLIETGDVIRLLIRKELGLDPIEKPE